MAVIAKKTEGLMDKASNTIQKGFSSFDKMVFLNEGQQDTINATATTFETYNKVVTNNIEEIEKSISSMTDVNQVKEVREAMERLQSQSMQDTTRKIAAGENVGIKQTKQFSEDLMIVRKGLGGLETQVSMSFDDLTNVYAKQITSQTNSDKAQDAHFRSLLIAMNEQSKYLQDQIRQMENQKDLDENQLALLEAQKRDLDKIKRFSSDTAKFSKMGPEEMKKNKDAIDSMVGQLSDQTFESKMFTTMNQVDTSIQSMSVDSERLNETMNDLTEAQMSGKEVIAGSAMKLKQGAKGMVSSMVLSAMGLGGLDEALGISEKFSQLDLFGKQGLFGKRGLLSNMAGLVKGGGPALAVAGAGAAGYAVGTGIKKFIDWVGGEEDYLGSVISRAIHGAGIKEATSTGDTMKKWKAMSGTGEGIDAALKDIDKFIKTKEKDGITKEEKRSIEYAQRMAEVLKRKKKKLEAGDKVKKEHKKEIEEDVEVRVSTVEDVGVEPVGQDVGENRMTDKVDVVSTKVTGDQIITEEISPKVLSTDVESAIGKKGVTPEELMYLPKTIQDTTSMIIDNTKEENKRIIEAQKQQAPIIIPPPTPPAPVDLNKSIDDPTLTIFNNDLFG